MSDYKLTPLERETIILWNEAEDVVYIDTCNPNLIKRLNSAKKKHPTKFKVEPPDNYGAVSAIVSKDVIRISLHAPMTEEKRERLSTQAKEWQEKNGVCPPFLKT